MVETISLLTCIFYLFAILALLRTYQLDVSHNWGQNGAPNCYAQPVPQNGEIQREHFPCKQEPECSRKFVQKALVINLFWLWIRILKWLWVRDENKKQEGNYLYA